MLVHLILPQRQKVDHNNCDSRPLMFYTHSLIPLGRKKLFVEKMSYTPHRTKSSDSIHTALNTNTNSIKSIMIPPSIRTRHFLMMKVIPVL